MTRSPEELRVVMLVANDVTNDSRVRKEAAALAEAGVQVTVLGVAANGQQSREMLDGAMVVRVAVPFVLRDERNAGRTKRRTWRPPLVGYPSKRAYLARSHRVQAGLKELKADSGHAIQAKKAGSAGQVAFKVGVLSRLVRRVGWQAARRGIWVRQGLGNQLNQPFKSAWRAWDGVHHRMTWPARWRRVHPEAIDLELAFGDLIDRLEPDVVHAHDMHVIGVAARAAGRAKLRGKDLKVVYDAHEYVPGIARYGARTRKYIAAWANHEREYLGAADRVVTVSSAIADRLKKEHKLPHLPTVILNTPDIPESVEIERDIRSKLRLPAEVPLLVYSGGITVVRGIETAIQALPSMPGVHLAVVAVPSPKQPAVDALRKLADELGVEDRMHYLHPVAPAEVTAFLSTADAGIIPMLRAPNHEMAMPNKLFEYSLGGLPVLVSDMASMKEFVTRTGIGEVFQAANSADLAEKAKLLLSRTDTYRERLADPAYKLEAAWSGQADRLRALYTEMLGRTQLEPVLDANSEAPGRRLLVGPVNSAGQAYLWTSAVVREVPTIAAESLTTGSGKYDFKVHRTGTYEQYREDLRWQLELTAWALQNVTHVLFEAGRPMFGQLPGQMWDQDVPMLDAAGIRHGLVFHGSEVRDPARHRAKYQFSPFADRTDELTMRLQAANDLLRQHLVKYEGPRFVTTPDLLEYVEESEWLPVVVDPDSLASNVPVMDREVPVVLHAPSASALKGSVFVDPVLTALDARGLIKYQRVQGVPHPELMAMVKDADIVVDQMLLGSYGVFACEAMAAGRTTVGHVADHVRDLLPTELPIVEATPDDLAEVIERLVVEREEARKIADAGPRYVRELHDGRKSVEALLPFLGGR
ncbi:glycosyltransferase [Kribbella sp. CA-293567]|uniref:glycosyltransferase n=1 Tax=Kribbella sp. CA-293567 TaxID=3002436 RepID=UPI0022DD8BAA|nr:glycosyltransferase [Kribbella sp. CA-293567]WBQ05011.1 glycosyltransferase [Kribbella sp. CA-293567]